MKPLNLKIKGLNSFSEEQTIDFEKLIKYGFFGIFGKTGSGKSTIIDAITLALYGKMSRFDGTGKGQFINTNSDSANVTFEFEISEGEEKTRYIVERNFKQKANALSSSKVRLMKKVNDIDTIIADKVTTLNEEIINILGLSYDDFTRTVVLPQGKFSDFLLLANDDRRQMLGRIFKLEKYGRNLSEKLKTKMTKVKTNLQLIDNSLSIYGEIDKDEILENKQLWEIENTELQKIKKEYSDILLAEKELKKIKEYNDEFRHYKNEKELLEAKKDDIEQKKIQLEKANNANLVYPIIKKSENLKIKIEKNILLLEEKCILQKNKTDKKDKEEINYESLLQQKEKNLPILQEQSFELKEAINIIKETEKYNNERNDLLKEYKIINDEKISIEKVLTDSTLKLTGKNDQLTKISSKKENIFIDADFRENIFKGFSLVTKKLEYSKKNDQLAIKVNIIEKELKQNNKKVSELTVFIIELEKQIAAIEKELTILNSQQINFEDTIDLHNQINNERNIYEQHLSIKNDLDKNNEKNNIISNNILNKEKYISDYKIVYEALKNDVNKIDLKIDEAKRKYSAHAIAKDLKNGQPCPVCGSMEHSEIIFDDKIDDLDNLKKIKEDFMIQYDEVFSVYQKSINELGFLQRDLEESNKTIENLKITFSDYDLQQGLLNINMMTEKKLSYKNITDEQNKTKLELEKNLNIKKDLLNNSNIEKATLIESVKKDKRNVDELNKEVEKMEQEFFDMQKLLYKIYDELKFAKSDSEIFNMWNKKIKQFDLEAVKLNEEENSLRIEIEKININIENLKKEVQSIEKTEEQLIAIGSEKKEIIKKNNIKIEKLSKGTIPEEELSVIETKIKKIIEEEQFYKKELEEIKTSWKMLSEEIITIENENNIFNDIHKEHKNEIAEKILELEFLNEEDVLTYILEKNDILELEKEINSFFESYTNATENYLRIQKKLQNKAVANIETRISAMELKINYYSNEIEEKTKFIAVLKEKINQMDKNFIEIENLLKSRKNEEYKFDLLEDLSKLFGASKFVEFISKKQLHYITREASVRLKEMSNGRYALELDDTEFTIRDDFNGGIRRSPKTLSGGETFITSLCLALALSSKIQLSNKNPLEFFFLDEGFGTLDLNSLDIVVSCLEKLRMEKLSIGVISHSEELMERTPIKLIVTPAVQFEAGSSVKII